MPKVIKKLAQKASRRIVKNEISKHARRPASEVFGTSWKHLLSRPLYRLLIRLGQNPVREGTQLKGRTFELLSAGIPDFYRSAKISISPGLQRAIEAPRPFLAVHLHDGHRFLSRVFAEHGRDVTRIVSDPGGYIRCLRQLGVDISRVHAIKDDLLSLAHLRKAIRANHILCSALDYCDVHGRRIYINPAVFGFANRSRIPVYFIKAHVRDDGRAELISAGPYLDVEPVACAKQFLDFFNSAGDSRVSMTVRRYNEHRDWSKHERHRPEKSESPSALPLD